MPEIDNILIRPATFDDLPDVAEIHVASWRYAYAGIVPQTFLDSLDVSNRLKNWIENFEGKAKEDSSLCLAFIDGKPVGFISYGRGRDAGMEHHGEIYAAYLISEAQGKAVGYKMFQTAKEKLIEDGFTDAYLWVLADNTRAMKAYQRWGGVMMDGIPSKEITIHEKLLSEIAIKFPL